ncbi:MULTISPECIES: hypothetical protein [Winslowiella]|nr:hypothetical protein [Winslowiella toletana]WNN46372.1 hypothetical protein RIN69_11225 [Winslowiella toletana]
MSKAKVTLLSAEDLIEDELTLLLPERYCINPLHNDKTRYSCEY